MSDPAPSPLGARIAAQIARSGPITVAEFMAQALGDPEHGYYTTRDPLGADGDFTTAPEISQMFGELLGLALAQTWIDQGRPTPFALAELGPGRGTLLADALRAVAGVPGFHQACRLHLVETSPTLRDAQAATLADHAVTWHADVGALPDGPLFVIANEFFDALPIRQFERTERAWREKMVTLDDEGALVFSLGPETQQGALIHRLGDTRPGDVVETCAPAMAIAQSLGARIAAQGGSALIVDYGGWRSLGDTLQAVRDHRSVEPLDAPGTADLTAHVDFEALAQAAFPARSSQATAQGVFLERLGITERAQTLARGLEGQRLSDVIAAHRRLTHPDEMGSVFKVLALWPKDAPPPAGVDP